MIYLIITTSIYNKIGYNEFEQRKKNYLDSIQQTINLIPFKLPVKVIIVENNNLKDSYLDIFTNQGCDIFYTDHNKYNFHHKGVNELLDIKSILNTYQINDNDIIIKITGRYHLINNYFYNLISSYQNEYEVFIKFFNVCTKEFVDNDCVLGLYAIKAKYLKSFEYNNFSLSPEVEFATFIKKNIDKDKIYSIKDLGLRCCFAYDLTILDV